MNSGLTLLVLSTLPAAPALGPPQFESVADVHTALRADQSSRRLDAVRFLRDYAWPRSAEVTPAGRDQLTDDLVRLLDDPAADIREAALDVLEAWHDGDSLSEAGRKAFSRALGRLVVDRKHPQRVRLARRLAKVDPSVAAASVVALRDALAGPLAEGDRVRAAVGLGELSPDDKPLAVKALREVMATGTADEARVDAARALVKLEPTDQPAAARVCREVAAKATGMAVLSAASALRKWKEVDVAEWSRLVAAGMERSDDPIDRGNLATALAVMQPPSKAPVPALLRVMNGPGAYARVKAADAELTLDPDRAREVVPVVRELLKDPELRGEEAAAVLGQAGPAAKDALPDLRAALKASPPREEALRSTDRVILLTAVGRVDPAGVPEAVAGLCELLRQSDGWGQMLAVGALKRFGPAARDAVPELIRYGRGSKFLIVRTAVAHTLAEVGRGSREAEALLREWAADDDPLLRPEAEAALKKLTARPDPK